MSRIGKKPITVPSGVEITVDGVHIGVKGPRGSLERVFPDNMVFSMEKTAEEGTVLKVSRPDDERENRALHGLSRALLANMVQGVAEGFRRELQVVGVGYRAALKGTTLELLLGFSHPVSVEAPDGITFEVPEPTRIVVSGVDKELVGQVAADIRKLCPPEPYKG
ncbi:MAG: 50S ribosomal protein L6, partial [Acidimicrobiia bacterium]